MLATNNYDAGIATVGRGSCAAVAAQAAVGPKGYGMLFNAPYEDAGCEGPQIDEINKIPMGTKLINVLVKMKNQPGSGMPEIGIVVSPGKASEGDSMCRIKQVVQGSPAHRAGTIRAGDVIRRINSIDVTRKGTEEVVAMIRKAAIDCKWTYGPMRLQLLRETEADGGSDSSEDEGEQAEAQSQLMTLMSIAIKKNGRMVASKKPNPIRLTLLQRSFCDRLDRALSDHGYYDAVYRL